MTALFNLEKSNFITFEVLYVIQALTTTHVVEYLIPEIIAGGQACAFKQSLL